MRPRLLLLLALLLSTGLAHAQEIEPTWLEVADIPLSLLSGPSSDDDIITQLTPREAVELLERGDQWSHIRRQDGTSGWAHNDYLLPWDERNRPDARRRVGERRLFRIPDHASSDGRMATIDAELRAVGDHSYVYAFARDKKARVPPDSALLGLAEQFDREVYRQSLELWDIEMPPAFGEDERVVILVVVGSGADPGNITSMIGWYGDRRKMPQEARSGTTGFIGISQTGSRTDVFLPHTVGMLAHQFQHMLHDQAEGNRVAWVSEGLAEFSAAHLGVANMNRQDFIVSSFLTRPRSQLNASSGAGLLVATYLYERLGLEALRNFATHPQQGLAALDALLAQRGEGMDADDFFADWVLANQLLDAQRNAGRYGYQTMGNNLSPPPPRSHVRALPAGFREALPPYSTDYFELSTDFGSSGRLLLDLHMAEGPPQDAWLQLVQVLPDRIDVQRYRASEYRGRPVPASLLDRPERIFVALSPFTPGSRKRTQPVHYSLALRPLPVLSREQAQVGATLNVRSEPEIADNILGKLQRCSVVRVLERGEEWSKILGNDGLSGWSHNDFLLQLNRPDSSSARGSCAALTRAARTGNLAAVQHLLATGHPVNSVDAWGRTALQEAAFWGHDTILQRLLQAGADVHARDAAGRNALDEALAAGNASSLLLDAAVQGLDLGSPSSRPLMLVAAAHGDTSLLDKLLDSGHDVNWQDKRGQSALAAAASGGQETSLKHLLAAGADSRLQDENGRSAFLQAAAQGQIRALSLLREAGANVNQRDHEGHTALTLAATNGHATALTWLLLGSEVDVHQSLSSNGRNALHLAAIAGHDNIVALLLLLEPDIGARDADDMTALQLAEAAGHREVAELFHVVRMANEPNADLESPARQTAVATPGDFLAAARNGDLAEVDRFIRSGVWLNLVDNRGMTALTHASRAGQRAVTLRLLLAGANPAFAQGRAIEHALRFGRDDIGMMLIIADGRHLGPEDREAISWAAEFGRVDVVRLLVDLCQGQRFCVDVRKESFDFKTPLHYAAIGGHEEIVAILLDGNADPNARDEFEFAPLYFANRFGHERVFEQLLDAGADPDGARVGWRLKPGG